MSNLSWFANREYDEAAESETAEHFAAEMRCNAPPDEWWWDHAGAKVWVRAGDESFCVSGYLWERERERVALRMARDSGSPIAGRLAMTDAAHHVRDHPSDLSLDELAADAKQAAADRDYARIDRRIAEIVDRGRDG